jgi:hypothetical protein
MPSFMVMDSFNYPHPLPGRFDLERINSFTYPEGMLALSAYYGLDTVIRITPSPIKEAYPSGINLRSEDLGEGRSALVYDTPEGSLRRVSQPSLEANTTFTIRHPIRERSDYQALLSLLRARQFSLDETNLAETRRILELLGTQGIAYSVGPCTPIMDLTRNWVGLEQFIYHLSDFTPLVESAMDAMAESCCRQYELIAQNTPCEVLVFWDDVNTRYISPALFKRYSIPVMRRFAEIAHANGKILVCHTCGHIAPLLKLFLETGVDAIDWVTPPPAADVDPREAQRIWGEQITMMLSVAPDIMRRGTPQQVEVHIRSLLDGLDLGRNLVFMIPPPVGTPLENVKRVIKILTQDYGVPLSFSAEVLFPKAAKSEK